MRPRCRGDFEPGLASAAASAVGPGASCSKSSCGCLKIWGAERTEGAPEPFGDLLLRITQPFPEPHACKIMLMFHLHSVFPTRPAGAESVHKYLPAGSTSWIYSRGHSVVAGNNERDRVLCVFANSRVFALQHGFVSWQLFDAHDSSRDAWSHARILTDIYVKHKHADVRC